MDRKKKSPAWRYYKDGPNKWEATCIFCNIVLRHHGCTTSLTRHVKTKHADEIDLSVNFVPPQGQESQVQGSTTTNNDVSNSKFRRRKSLIWKFFNPRPGRKEARCALCGNIIRNHGQTSSLARHLKTKHVAEAQSINLLLGNKGLRFYAPSTSQSDVTVTTLPPPTPIPKLGKNDEVSKPPNNRAKQTILDQKVLTMIIMDLQPMSFVDSNYFADVIKLADPRYSLPSKTTFTSELLPKLYKETVDRVLYRLEDIKHAAITTELWSPRHQESYLGVTAHFVCPTKWSFQSLMLSTTTFYGTPSGKDIACELERTVAEWNITDKVRVMVADNETNARLANEQLPWAYIPCLAHLINIVVIDAISADADTTTLIEKVCDIVRHFKGDDNSKENLAEVQRSLNLPERSLVFDCVPSSRWNSIYFMLERTLEQADAINAVMVACENEEMCLTSRDRGILGMVISVLKPFEIATKTMSSEKSTTISTAMPLVKGLMKMMSSFSATGGKEPLVTALKEGLAESFGKIEDIDWIVAATVLDPRFKNCPYIEKEVITKATEIITAEVSSMCEPETASDSDSTSKTEDDSLWMFLDHVMMNSVPQEQKVETPSAAVMELRRYLDSPPVSRDDDPLLYWKQHQELFPTLCQLAMKYLTVPITSVPGERFFTEAGEALVEKRSKLRAENISMMLFLNKNLPYFGLA